MQTLTKIKSVSQVLTEILLELGIEYAFGVSGGAIGTLWTVLEQSSIKVLHFHHESGAAFAATEVSLASQKPVVVFATTGPGITNVLTGMMAAKSEGAKVILLSGYTPTSNRGKKACQETSIYTMASTAFISSGDIFDYGTILESPNQLPGVIHRLKAGTQKVDGFVAHLSIPTDIQTTIIPDSLSVPKYSASLPSAGKNTITKCIELLSEGSFVIWVGFGARNSKIKVRQLAEKTGCAVMSSARAKGIFPEDNPQYIGVTGFGGHTSVGAYLSNNKPKHILVLGSGLGEFTSLWSPQMIPDKGFIHVDINPDIPGSAYPTVETFSIHSEIDLFLDALLEQLPRNLKPQAATFPSPEFHRHNAKLAENLVRPAILMEKIQEIIVETHQAIVMAEAGNSIAWAINCLRFSEPNYRLSNSWAAMGHMATGVLGACLGSKAKAVAIVGDGALLMNNEINTAVKYEIPAVWIVLNDARYNMCEQGNALRNLEGADAQFPQADFVTIARGMGATGIRVEKESELTKALELAMKSTLPFVVDVLIDPSCPAPIGGRVLSLLSQDTKDSSTASLK